MRKLFLLAATLAFLTGCQSFSNQQSARSQTVNLPIAKAHAENLAKIQRWTAKGKIKITVDEQPQSASFEWQQFKQNYAINFFGPFGYGASWLRRTSKGVTLESPEQPAIWAPSPEQLLQQTVGWQAPISELQYWIKGQPAPNAIVDQIELASEGAYSAFRQQGWDIHLSQHTRYGKVWLPQKIVATRQSLSVLIIVKVWDPQ